jgi:alkyl hydroperoxide reductase subunit AhpF
MYLDEQVSADIKERFAEMVHPVKLVVFSQALQHPESEEVKRLIEELAALDTRLIVDTKNFVIDRDTAEALKVHHIPGVAIVRAGTDGAPDIDYGVRFFGLPMQYDFGVLIDAIVDVSKGKSGLDTATVEALNALQDPIHLQVFTTPT